MSSICLLVGTDDKPFPEIASHIASKYAAGIDVEVARDNRKLDFGLELAAGNR